MRFSIRPEPRQEQKMQTLSIEEVILACEHDLGARPTLEHYFSPTKRKTFIKEFLHYLNSGLLDAKHGKLDKEKYIALILSFQFSAPLLEIPAEKELGLFYRILQKNYRIEELDLNLHFSMADYEGDMVSEKEALQAFRSELDGFYGDSLEVKGSVQKRIRKDGIASIMEWQREQSKASLAEAFGRSVVIPSFFSYSDKRLLHFYKQTTEGITYRVAIPDSIV